MTATCERINTYEVLEHVMGINGLHPHRLRAIRNMRRRLVHHVSSDAELSEGIVLDIGCGSGDGTYELASMFKAGQRVIGIDINGHAINTAKMKYAAQTNLSFYHGDLKGLLIDNPGLRISSAISISVSMFLNDIEEFYTHIYQSLTKGGIFIDAPFTFREIKQKKQEQFHRRTYAVCGCNMTMKKLTQLKLICHEAGFNNVESVEHDFDLMKIPILFDDYSAFYLFKNFVKNTLVPPAHFGSITSYYLFKRTLKIFMFFLINRQKYSAGELIAIKQESDHH
jgi:ubiquinone/menaquinone biosynthesis C-methylase UbiE